MRKKADHSVMQRHAIHSGSRIIRQNVVLKQDNDPKHSSDLCINLSKIKGRYGNFVNPDLAPSVSTSFTN